MKHLSHQSHSDVINTLSNEITEVFESVGADAPALSELYASDHWRYCRTEDKKSKGKIGFLCHHEWKNNHPRVIIIIHSFRAGGETIRFDSQRYLHKKSQVAIVPERRSHTTEAAQRIRQQKAEQEIKRKKQRTIELLNEWCRGTDSVLLHSYVLTKHIEHLGDLRLISQNRVAYPLYNMAGETEGIQTIDPNGSKRIHGKKKGNYGLIGDIESATRLYLCEGFSTASTVYALVEACQKRKSSFAVIIGMDADNLKAVAKQFKTHYPEKKLVICPDNDGLKQSKEGRHLPNAGLLSGYQAAIENYTELKLLPRIFAGSDWNDAWRENRELAIEAFDEKKRIRLTDYTQEILRCFRKEDNSIGLKKATVRALYTAGQSYPAKLREPDFLPQIIEAVSHTNLNEKTVKAWWTRIKRRRFGMAMRTKSVAREQAKPITTHDCHSIQEIHAHVQTLKEKHPKAIFITNAPMGTGKTKDFMQPEFMAAEIKGHIPIVITPTKALTKGVSERFRASHYLDDEMQGYEKKQRVIPASLAITINSIILPKYHEVLMFSRALFIDEYTQVLRSIALGTVENHQRQATESQLANMMQQAKYLYIADADFNQIALDHLQAITNNSRPIFLLTLQQSKKQKPVKSMEPITYRYHEDNDPNYSNKLMLRHITEAAQAKQKIYVASDSKSQLEYIERALRQYSISTLSVTSESLNFSEQSAFLNQPNDYLEAHQPQVVLVSPAIQSGVSIEVDYFDRCFGIYTGVVTPVVFQQMLHRVRSHRSFDLSLPFRHGSQVKETENSAALLMAAYQQHIRQFGGETKITYDPKTKLHTIGSIQIKETLGQITIQGDKGYGRYEKLCAELKALDNQQRNQAANFLLMQAMAREIHIEYVSSDLSDFKRTLVKATFDQLKEETKQENVRAIATAPALTEEQYQQKKQQGGATTRDDQHQLTRYEIATELNLESDALDTNDIEFYQQNGTRFIANYQALLQGPQQAEKNDSNDKENGVAKINMPWRTSKVMLLALIFKTLDIDSNTGQGIFNKTKAKTARQTIQNQEELKRYITFKLNLQVESHLPDVSFMNKILKKLLGLKSKRTLVREGEERHWIYELDPVCFKQLTFYHQQRYGLKFDESNDSDLSPEKVLAI